MWFILRWVINAVALFAVASILPGFGVDSLYAALIASLVLGLINALVRPVIIFLTLPATVLTLGLFIFVINAFMLWLMSTIVKGISIDGFVTAFMAAILLWVVSFFTNHLIQHAKDS